HPESTLFPYTTLFRSFGEAAQPPRGARLPRDPELRQTRIYPTELVPGKPFARKTERLEMPRRFPLFVHLRRRPRALLLATARLSDRKSTRLNSSHRTI